MTRIAILIVVVFIIMVAYQVYAGHWLSFR